jgi:hypothetical protein
MTVSELLNKVDSAEISEWIAFFGIENETEDDKKQENLGNKLMAALGATKDGKSKN